jgi:hypothetical protein
MPTTCTAWNNLFEKKSISFSVLTNWSRNVYLKSYISFCHPFLMNRYDLIWPNLFIQFDFPRKKRKFISLFFLSEEGLPCFFVCAFVCVCVCVLNTKNPTPPILFCFSLTHTRSLSLSHTHTHTLTHFLSSSLFFRCNICWYNPIIM